MFSLVFKTFSMIKNKEMVYFSVQCSLPMGKSVGITKIHAHRCYFSLIWVYMFPSIIQNEYIPSYVSGFESKKEKVYLKFENWYFLWIFLLILEFSNNEIIINFDILWNNIISIKVTQVGFEFSMVDIDFGNERLWVQIPPPSHRLAPSLHCNIRTINLGTLNMYLLNLQ